MKKLLYILTAAVMLISCGCSGDDSGPLGSSTDSSVSRFGGGGSKDSIFTEKKYVGNISFKVPSSAVESPSDSSEGIDKRYVWDNNNYLIGCSCLPGEMSLEWLEKENPFNATKIYHTVIENTPAIYFDTYSGKSFMSQLFFNYMGNNYMLVLGSSDATETMVYLSYDLYDTVSMEPDAEFSFPASADAAGTADTSAGIPESSFALFTVRGTGSKVIRDISLPPVVCVTHMLHSGSSNFIAHYYDASGSRTLLSNEIGVIDSYQVFDATGNSGTDGGMLEVDADGSWSITFMPIADKVSRSEKSSFSGRGDDVVGSFTASGLTVCKGGHRGDSNFIVEVYELSETGGRVALAFNEIGTCSGETVLRTEAGKRYFFNVVADGSWQLEVGG